MEAVESNLTRLNPLAMSQVSARLMSIAFGNEAVAVFDFHRALCVRLLARMSVGMPDSFVQALTALEKISNCALVHREIAAARQRLQ